MRELAEQTGETVILVRLIGRSAVCVHRVQSAQQLRISFEPGQSLPLDRGASARLLLASLAPDVRQEYLAPLAERDPEAAQSCLRRDPARRPARRMKREEIYPRGVRLPRPRSSRASAPWPCLPCRHRWSGRLWSIGPSCCARSRPRPPPSARGCAPHGDESPLSFPHAGIQGRDPGDADQRWPGVADRSAGRDGLRRAELNRADRLLPAAHRPPEPGPARRHHGEPRSSGRGGGQRRGPRGAGPARSARGHPGADQGQNAG